MEQMMPARLAGLFELDPWCEAPPEAIEEVFAKVQAKYGASTRTSTASASARRSGSGCATG